MGRQDVEGFMEGKLGPAGVCGRNLVMRMVYSRWWGGVSYPYSLGGSCGGGRGGVWSMPW